MGGFRWSQGCVEVRLGDGELAVLGVLPGLLAGVGGPGDPATARLDYVAHPGDPDAEATFRDLVGDDLDEARDADRRRFEATIGVRRLSEEDARVWLRVIGEARLVLAARLGIAEDGWSDRMGRDEPPQLTLLRALGALQDELATTLLGRRS